MVVPRRLRWQAALTHLGRLPRAAERGESGRGGGRISVSVYRSWQRRKIALRRFRLGVPDAYFARFRHQEQAEHHAHRGNSDRINQRVADTAGRLVRRRGDEKPLPM